MTCPRELTSRRGVSLWGTGSLFPLGLELEASAYDPLKIPHKEERCLEKKIPNPNGHVEPLGPAVPPTTFSVPRANKDCLMKASLD